MKKILKINGINYLVLIFFEMVFALISFDIYSKGEVLSILIYSLFVSFVMTILMTIWSEKVNRIFGYIIYFVLCFWFALETVFKAFLQTFFSFCRFLLQAFHIFWQSLAAHTPPKCITALGVLRVFLKRSASTC